MPAVTGVVGGSVTRTSCEAPAGVTVMALVVTEPRPLTDTERVTDPTLLRVKPVKFAVPPLAVTVVKPPPRALPAGSRMRCSRSRCC